MDIIKIRYKRLVLLATTSVLFVLVGLSQPKAFYAYTGTVESVSNESTDLMAVLRLENGDVFNLAITGAGGLITQEDRIDFYVNLATGEACLKVPKNATIVTIEEVHAVCSDSTVWVEKYGFFDVDGYLPTGTMLTDIKCINGVPKSINYAGLEYNLY